MGSVQGSGNRRALESMDLEKKFRMMRDEHIWKRGQIYFEFRVARSYLWSRRRWSTAACRLLAPREQDILSGLTDGSL